MNDETKNEVKFEDAMSRLEEIVNKLEDSQTSLDESIKLFEEGTKLADICAEKLKNAKQKITVLTEGKSNG